MRKSPENMKWRARLLKQQFGSSVMSEKPPAEFSKILSTGINFIIAKILKLINIQENLYFIMPS